MKTPEISVDRRTSPRVWVYAPVEYQLNQAPLPYGGIAVDASEKGFHIFSTRNIPIGAKLKIQVLFLRQYELSRFEVIAEVVWKKLSVDRKGRGFQYGLKFVEISEEDYRKLKALLGNRSSSEETPDCLWNGS